MTQNNQNSNETAPLSHNKKVSAVSIVWLVPLIALITGIWLLISTIKQTGPEITLHLPNAEGIVAGSTVIKLLNVEVGRITAISLNEQHDGVILKARMSSDVHKLLLQDTQFWLVKPRIDRSGVTGLGTLVSGVYIEMTPGKQGNEQRIFTVSDSIPSTFSGSDGLHLRLHSEANGLIPAGSPVLFRGIEVGTIDNADFDPITGHAQYRIFIRSPNESLIGQNTRFWISDGVNIDMTGSGVNISAPPVGALLGGAIAFDDPKNGQRGEKVGTDTQFILYRHETIAPDTPDDSAIHLVAFFDQSVRSLSVGSAVTYKGITIGRVADVPYFTANDKAKLFDNKKIPVHFYIDSQFFKNQQTEFDQKQWQKSVNTAIDGGVYAILSSDNLITGSEIIELIDTNQQNSPKPHIQQYAGYKVIATGKGGLGQLQVQMNDLLDKINKLPIDKTLQEVNRTLLSVENLLNDSDTKQLPHEMRNTLSSLKETLEGVSPNSPAYQDIRNTLQRIDTTLQKAEPILRTLEEKPNALIFPSTSNDIIPKGHQ